MRKGKEVHDHIYCSEALNLTPHNAFPTWTVCRMIMCHLYVFIQSAWTLLHVCRVLSPAWLIYNEIVFYCVSYIHWLYSTRWEHKEGACFVQHRYRSVKAYVCERWDRSNSMRVHKRQPTVCVYTSPYFFITSQLPLLPAVQLWKTLACLSCSQILNKKS